MKMVHSILQDFLFPDDIFNTYIMRSNYAVPIIVTLYLLFVKFWGPRLMERRKAMELTNLIRLFNALLVLGNMYLCVKAIYLAVAYRSHHCNMKFNSEFMDVAYKTQGLRAYQAVLIKIVELLDTVFFVLRKKTQQVSFLHLFHHSLVALGLWTVLKAREVGYYVILIGAINCGVHVIMYTYYCLAAFGPNVRKYLWWKKYLTALQILQFFVLLIYLAYSFATNCEDFGLFEGLTFGGTAFLCVLFLQFYVQSYRPLVDTSHTGKSKQ